MAVAFISARDPLFTTLGILFAFLACSGVYAYVKNEVWSMTIEDGVLTWSSPRWPKSSGKIKLCDVDTIGIQDGSGKVTLVMADGTQQQTRLVGYGANLRDYLKAHHPQITVNFFEGSS